MKLNDKLVVFRDRKIIFKFEFRSKDSEVVIGSHHLANIVLKDLKVADFHARVTCKKGQYQLEDLGSENGTYLNGKKVLCHEAVELQNGSSVRIMACDIHFEIREKQSTPKHSVDKLKIQGKSNPDDQDTI